MALHDLEEKFRLWARPPSTVEQQRMTNAEQIIRNAVSRSPKLNALNLRVMAQGSYRNNTNIPVESDVDVAIICSNPFFSSYPPGTNSAYFGNTDSNYLFSEFKADVEAALADYLGPRSLQRKNKTFLVKETTYHVDADATPFYEHRRYSLNGSWTSGIETRPDDNPTTRIINWPDQHNTKGIQKNNDTGRRYKSVVRILKSLRDEMEQNDIASAKDIPRGFLLECLAYNVENQFYGNELLSDDVLNVLSVIRQFTQHDAYCSDWKEVSELKELFAANQKWTRAQVFNFASDAIEYIVRD